MTRRYFLFDVETGGLSAVTTSLFTLYGLILDQNLDVLDKIDLKVKPNDGIYHVSAAALKINKIDIVKHDETALPEKEAATKLRDFLFRHTSCGTTKLIPAGHNIGRLDIPMLERLVSDYSALFVHRTLDTGSIGQFLQLIGVVPETNNGSLAQLSIHFGIDASKNHDAQGDVEMTHLLLKAAIKSYPKLVTP
jgi:DNA polymerase III alpha subunit (gram-positive type)